MPSPKVVEVSWRVAPAGKAAADAKVLARVERVRTHLVPIAVASALLMEFIDSTALSTALPTLARAFATDPVHLKLALTSYLLALAVFAPASGWVADRFGARPVFLGAMATFLTGSLLCGLSVDLPELVGARILQGIGGAMMTPVGRLIIVELSPKERLVSAMAWFTTPALIGPIIGPPLAGFLLQVAPWPVIFFINIPIGILGAIAVSRLVPRIERPNPGPFDAPGFALLSLAIVGLIAAAELTGMRILSAKWVVLLALAAALFLWLYVRHSRRTDSPVLNLDLLRIPTFRASLIGGTVIRMGLGASPFLLPLLLQLGLGWSPSKAGMVMIAMGVGALLARSIVAQIIRQAGFKTVLIGSGILASLLTAAPALFGQGTGVVLAFVVLAFAGFLRSVQFTATNSIAYADVPEERVSSASSFATLVQQVGMSLGVSTGALALTLAGGVETHAGGSFTIAFLLVGAISLLAAPIYLELPASAGDTIRGARVQHLHNHPHP